MLLAHLACKDETVDIIVRARPIDNEPSPLLGSDGALVRCMEFCQDSFA